MAWWHASGSAGRRWFAARCTAFTEGTASDDRWQLVHTVRRCFILYHVWSLHLCLLILLHNDWSLKTANLWIHRIHLNTSSRRYLMIRRCPKWSHRRTKLKAEHASHVMSTTAVDSMWCWGERFPRIVYWSCKVSTDGSPITKTSSGLALSAMRFNSKC